MITDNITIKIEKDILYFTDCSRNLHITKNSSTYSIDYGKEVITVLGHDVYQSEVLFHLFGNLEYEGINSYSTLEDPLALPTTSRNFKSLCLLVRDFVDNYSGNLLSSSKDIAGIVNNTGVGEFSIDTTTYSFLNVDNSNISIVDNTKIRIPISPELEFSSVCSHYALVIGNLDSGYRVLTDYNASGKYLDITIYYKQNIANIAVSYTSAGGWVETANTATGNTSIFTGDESILYFTHDACVGIPYLSSNSILSVPFLSASTPNASVFQISNKNGGLLDDGSTALFFRELGTPVPLDTLDSGISISFHIVVK